MSLIFFFGFKTVFWLVLAVIWSAGYFLKKNAATMIHNDEIR